MSQKIDLKSLTAEQKEELYAQVEAERRQAKEAKKAEEDTYKDLVSETVTNSVLHLQRVSAGLGKAKGIVFDNFRDLITMKAELFDIELEKQKTHTFTSKDSTMRITLGYHTQDNYDDTVNVGIEKVQEYIATLATDDKSKQLVGMVNKLLAKDNAGNLKASRVLQLKKQATESRDQAFIDAVEIIENAYNPIKSKQFVRAEYKHPKSNEWQNVPLGMTEAQMPTVENEASK